MKFYQDLCKIVWYELNPRVRCVFGNVFHYQSNWSSQDAVINAMQNYNTTSNSTAFRSTGGEADVDPWFNLRFCDSHKAISVLFLVSYIVGTCILKQCMPNFLWLIAGTEMADSEQTQSPSPTLPKPPRAQGSVRETLIPCRWISSVRGRKRGEAEFCSRRYCLFVRAMSLLPSIRGHRPHSETAPRQ